MFQLRKGYEVDIPRPGEALFLDDAGLPAAVDGVPVWQVADPSILTIIPADDGMSAVLQGTSEVIGAKTDWTVEADADLGEGVVQVIGGDTVMVVSGQAATVNTSYGDPRPIAAPTP